MKILFVQNVVGIAGSENYFLQILPELVKRGINVEFLCLYPFKNPKGYLKFEEKLQQEGIKFYAVPFKGIPTFNLLNSIKQIITAGHYSLIHTHLIHADFFIALSKFIYRTNWIIVSTKHGYEEQFLNRHGFDHNKVKPNLYYLLAYFSEKFIRRSFAVSKGVYNLYRYSGISKPEKLEVIYHGLDFESAVETSELSVLAEKQKIIITGRLVEFKGHRFAFEAIKILKEKYPNIILILIGTGEQEENLRQLAIKLNISAFVNFLGYKSNPRAYMKEADIILIPSVSEAFGLVTLEAFSVEKPVVAFDVPALNELIVDYENGLLVKPFDTKELAEKIEILLTNPGLRKQLVENAKNKLKNEFSLKRMVDETVQFYTKAIVN
jgi:glycosyltransferase involved in cell wall biosynthesis